MSAETTEDISRLDFPVEGVKCDLCDKPATHRLMIHECGGIGLGCLLCLRQHRDDLVPQFLTHSLLGDPLLCKYCHRPFDTYDEFFQWEPMK